MIKRPKIAIYLRISKKNRDAHFKIMYRGREESLSIYNQRMILLKYIRNDSKLANAEIVEFCDDGFSGTNMERPGMQEMLKQLKTGQIGCVLVKDMSRFARNYIEMGTYLDEIFPFLGVDFIAINDGYDSRERKDNNVGVDTVFQTLLYDLYSKDISVKTKTSIENKCANGEYVFGQVPFGYEKSQKVKNTVVVNEKEAKIVRYIFAMAAEGMGSSQIAKQLFLEQVPTATQMRYPKRSKKENHTWSATMIRSILDNRFYLGEMAYGKTVTASVGSRHKTRIPKSDWKVIENHHAPLVTQEIFVKAALALPGHSTERGREPHPFTGKIYCGGCGYSMNYKPGGKRSIPRHFWCRKHALLQIPDCCTYFNAVILEETVLTFLNRELAHRGNVLKQRVELNKFQEIALKKSAIQKKEYEGKLRSAQKEKNLLYETYANGRIDAEAYRIKADQLNEQIKVLFDRISIIKSDYSRLEEEITRDKYDMKQVIYYAHLDELTKEAVDIFIKKITVYKDKRVEIEWNFTE